ncbi:MAG TPA: hypothetical protein VK387_05120 [Thermoleophilaceae bacterium]|nr:hypothetical protein [Thermoleophilaceae bacterium]
MFHRTLNYLGSCRTITGGSGVVIEGGTGWSERVLDVVGASTAANSTDATITDTTIRKGNATVGGAQSTWGGGIRVNGAATVANGASLTLRRSTVTDNVAVATGGGIRDEFRAT